MVLSWLGCVLMVLLLVRVNCITRKNFFPSGDETLHLGDDDSSDLISLRSPLPILGRVWTSLRITANGVVALNDEFGDYIAQSFPYTDSNLVIICPFWADLDTRRIGTISHNNANATITARVTQLIQNSFGYTFTPTVVFIATWDGLPHHDALNHPHLKLLSKTNTFQCVLATDGNDTFVMFLYADGLIQWTRGGVQIGIDGGDEVNYYSVPGSLTPSIINITRTSNVDQPGLWIFKLDTHIIAGPPISPIRDLTVLSVGATKATLEWTVDYNASSGGVPESCLVVCVAEPTTENTTSVVYLEDYPNQTEYTHVMAGLEEHTNYTCIITVNNLFGEGPTSDPVHLTTDSTAPSGPPVNVCVSSLSPTSLRVEWSPPSEEERNGLITGYSVLLEWQAGQDIVNTSHTSHTFTQLHPQTTYHCSIAAHTSAGIGPYFNITATTATPTTPNAVFPVDNYYSTTANTNDNYSTTTANTDDNYHTNSKEKTKKFGLIGGVSGGAFLAFTIIILSIIIIAKKRKNKHSVKETQTTAELTPQRPVLTLSNNYLEDPDDEASQPPSTNVRSEKKPTKKTPMLPPTSMKVTAEMPPPAASSGTGSDGVYMALCKVEKRGPGQENNQYMSLCNIQQRERSSPMMQRSLIAGEGKGDKEGAYMNYNHKEQQKVAVEAYCMGVVSPGRPECREAPVYMNQKQMAGAGAKKTSLPAAQVTRKYETPAYVNLKLKQSH